MTTAGSVDLVAIDFGKLGVGDLSDLQPEIRQANWLSRGAFDRSTGEVTVYALDSRAKRAQSDEFATFHETLNELDLAPGLVRALEFGRASSGHDFIVFPRPSRFSIQDGLSASSMPSWRTAVAAIQAVAESLIPVHNAGLAHGHIRPSVVLVGAEQDPELIEPGLALLENEAKIRLLGPDQHDSIRYRAPEFLAGERPTSRTDVYGLGITLWSYLQGRSPHGDVGLSTTELVEQARFEPLDDLGLHVPKSIRSVIALAVSKNPIDRFEDAAAMFAALDEAAASQIPLSASGAIHQPAFIPSTPTRDRLGLSLVPKVAVGATALICALSVGAWASSRSGSTAPEEPKIQILGSTTIRETTTSQQIVTERPLVTTTSLVTTTTPESTQAPQTTGAPRTTIRRTTIRRATTTTAAPATTTTTAATTTTTTAPPVATIKPGSTTVKPTTSVAPTTSTPVETTVPAPTEPPPTEPPTTTAPVVQPTFTLPEFVIEILERRRRRR